jgi:hypothetical protein
LSVVITLLESTALAFENLVEHYPIFARGITAQPQLSRHYSIFAVTVTFACNRCVVVQAVVGEEALTQEDHLFIKFVEKFEGKFIAQGGYQNRTIFESLDLAWELLRTFPQNLLSKIDPKMREKYYPRGKTSGRPTD